MNKQVTAGKIIDQATDRSHDIWRYRAASLDAFFRPKSVALIGASEQQGSVGRTVLKNLINSPFGGVVYPLNTKRASVLGIRTYAMIKDVPDKVELAIIATPAATVPGVVGECVQAGVKAAIIISAGFKERGEPGMELERRILEIARKGNMRIIGPNCLGVMCPTTGLNATFASQLALKGNVGFVSQSGALCTAILDWSLRERIGFSAFVSIGSMVDVGWGDLIDYLSEDASTQSILIYMETIGDARSFLSAAREAALRKPIIIIKAGRTEAAAKAAISHTGSLAGSDQVLDAVFRRAGVLRVNEISDLFNMADILAKQPRPKGSKLTIITNAGGPGVLATDEHILAGGELSPLSAETMESLNAVLPEHWSHSNPIDILGDASPERYAKTLEIISRDASSDGVLVALTPQAMTEPTETAEKLCSSLNMEGRPLLASWMGGKEVERGREILRKANIPVFDYPDTAARMFNYMWRYNSNIRSLYETPVLPPTEEDQTTYGNIGVHEVIRKAREMGRTVLNELESKQILASYGIAAVETCVAREESEAVCWAQEFGFPVVLKLFSNTVTHKTDVGGVRLNVKDSAGVRKAFQEIRSAVTEKVGAEDFLGVTVQPMISLDGYELIIGSSVDAQFGPVILFGMGGPLVEVFDDHALGLPPLNTTLARRMMEQTHIFRALRGVRGRSPVDLARLEQLLVRFSWLVTEQRWIKEFDINPLLVSPDKMVALDARAVLHDRNMSKDQLPKTAIRPYPREYIKPWKMKDGTRVTLRPIRPEDEPMIVQFHKTLSEHSVRQRYFHAIKLDQRIAHERLIGVCFNDYDRELALVAVRTDSYTGAHEIIAVGRLSRLLGKNEAEIAVVVSDRFQQRGLGTELVKCLLEVGRRERLHKIKAQVLSENAIMQRLFQKVGFSIERDPQDDSVKAVISLSPS